MENQRVNIQYSVNLEEVPNLVMQLLGEAINRLEETSNDASAENSEMRKQLGTYNNPAYTIEQIDKIRLALADVDYRLSDCAQMLTGLVQLNTQAPPSDAPAASDAVEQINQAATAAAVAAQSMGLEGNE